MATEWAIGVGAVIALVAGMGVLAKTAIIVLVLAGGIGLSLAASEHGWLFPKALWKPILILIGIWGSMAFIGWKAWPHDLETASIDWTTPQAIDTGTQDLALTWRGFPHH